MVSPNLIKTRALRTRALEPARTASINLIRISGLRFVPMWTPIIFVFAILRVPAGRGSGTLSAASLIQPVMKSPPLHR